MSTSNMFIQRQRQTDAVMYVVPDREWEYYYLRKENLQYQNLNYLFSKTVVENINI